MIIYTLKQLIKNNVHLGHYVWECDYRLIFFLLGVRNSIHIINIYNTLYMLKCLIYTIYNLGLINQRVLLVNNINYNIPSLLNKFNKKKLWYLNDKWTGGILTNQKHIYVYNEKLFYKYYNLGYKSILPSFVFVSNIENSSSCIFEAIILNILNSSLFDTNLGFYGILYKLCSNDDNFVIMSLFTKILAKTYIKSIYDKKKVLIKKRERRKDYKKDRKIKKIEREIWEKKMEKKLKEWKELIDNDRTFFKKDFSSKDEKKNFWKEKKKFWKEKKKKKIKKFNKNTYLY